MSQIAQIPERLELKVMGERMCVMQRDGEGNTSENSQQHVPGLSRPFTRKFLLSSSDSSNGWTVLTLCVGLVPPSSDTHTTQGGTSDQQDGEEGGGDSCR